MKITTLESRDQRRAVLAHMLVDESQGLIAYGEALGAVSALAYADPESRTEVVAAFSGGEDPIGMALLTPKAPGCVVRLDYLYVVGSERGQGVGSCLVRALTETNHHLQLACIPSLRLFYTRLGFHHWMPSDDGGVDVIGGTTTKALRRGFMALLPFAA